MSKFQEYEHTPGFLMDWDFGASFQIPTSLFSQINTLLF